MTAKSSQRLADVLLAAGFNELANRAAEDEFHDFLSPNATPSVNLDMELVALINDNPIGSREHIAAVNIRGRHHNGDFDADEAESEEWAASDEGKATIDRLMSEVKTKPTLGDAPIDPEFRDKMNRLARSLQTLFNGEGTRIADSKVGFALMVFHMNKEGGRANYISNAQRADVITLLKEQVARFEGMPEQKGHA